MKNYLRQVLDFILFSNIFIGLCAAAQGMVTYYLLGEDPDKYVLGILLFSTIALYNFSIFLAKPAKPELSAHRRVQWIFSHQRMVITITIISVLSLIPLFLFLSATSKLLLVFLAALSVAYNLPFFTINDKKIGLRSIPGVKLFLISLVWSLSCVLLPILELESNHIVAISSKDTILLLAKRFLFIAAITVPFDIRDLFDDKQHELKTIPVMLGEKKAYLFCQVLLIAYLVLLFLFNQSIDLNFAALLLTIILTGWLIFKSEWKRNEYYYFLYLDGTMILQFVFLTITHILNERY